MTAKRCWAKLIIPPSLSRMQIAREAARNIAQECGFSTDRINFIELAIEETVGTILRHVTEDDDIDDAQLHIQIEVEAPLLRVCIVNKGLPFDPADISEYDATQIKLMMSPEGEKAETINNQNTAFDSELALFLLKQSVDRYYIQNAGKEGISFKLEWFLPDKHISEQVEPKDKTSAVTATALPQTSEPVTEPEDRICVLTEKDAIGISQLIYRSYGATYPHEDFYFPARLQAHQNSGRIRSWGVITSGGKVVGHLALQKSHPAASAVEWGAVVVDPQWRSAGLMKKMLVAAIQEMEQRSEIVFFVHAVTTHPFTQKTCNRFGFVPTALLFGFASDDLRFRGFQEQAVTQRESMFFAARLLRPLPVQRLYPPARHRETLDRLFASLGLSLDELTSAPSSQNETSDKSDGSQPEIKSVISTTTISSINIGSIDVTKTGTDFATQLSRELRRLCRERVDMVYLNIDLGDSLAEAAVGDAEDLGFFLAGWQPLQPFPYTLTLQYANTTKVDFDGVIAEGDQAVWLKQIIAQEREKSEKV